MPRNRNRYAALAAARRGDWPAIKDDTLDLLELKGLAQVEGAARQHPRSPERDAALALIRDEIMRREIDAAYAAERGDKVGTGFKAPAKPLKSQGFLAPAT